MLIALLVLLGVDLIVVVALLVFVLGRRRWLKRQPGEFSGAIRVVHGEVGGLGSKWKRGSGRWVRDVLVWTKAPLLLTVRGGGAERDALPVFSIPSSGGLDGRSFASCSFGRFGCIRGDIAVPGGGAGAAVDARDSGLRSAAALPRAERSPRPPGRCDGGGIGCARGHGICGGGRAFAREWPLRAAATNRRLRIARLVAAAGHRSGGLDLDPRRRGGAAARRRGQPRRGRAGGDAGTPGRGLLRARVAAAPGLDRRLLLPPGAARLHPRRR